MQNSDELLLFTARLANLVSSTVSTNILYNYIGLHNVSNYYCCVLQVKLVAQRSDAFDLINNTTSTERTRSRANIGRLRVCARTTATHSFHLVARQLGHINFTVQVIHLLTYLLTWQGDATAPVLAFAMAETTYPHCGSANRL